MSESITRDGKCSTCGSPLVVVLHVSELRVRNLIPTGDPLVFVAAAVSGATCVERVDWWILCPRCGRLPDHDLCLEDDGRVSLLRVQEHVE